MSFPYTIVPAAPALQPQMRSVLANRGDALTLFGLYGAAFRDVRGHRLAAIGYALPWNGRLAAGVVRPASTNAVMPSRARLLGLICRTEGFAPDAVPPGGLPVFAHFQSPGLLNAAQEFSPPMPFSIRPVRIRMRIPRGPPQVYARTVAFRDVSTLNNMSGSASRFPDLWAALEPARPAAAWQRPGCERIPDDIVSRQAKLALSAS